MAWEEIYLDLEENKGEWFGRNSEPLLQSTGPFVENTKMSLAEGSSVGRWEETQDLGSSLDLARTGLVMDWMVGGGERMALRLFS